MLVLLVPVVRAGTRGTAVGRVFVCGAPRPRGSHDLQAAKSPMRRRRGRARGGDLEESTRLGPHRHAIDSCARCALGCQEGWQRICKRSVVGQAGGL